MILVPEDVLARYERKQKIETSPLVTGMMQQDAAMSGILESENLTDAEKQKLYNARMEDYLSLRKQKDDQIPTVRVTRNEGEPLREPLRDADVIAHLPATPQGCSFTETFEGGSECYFLGRIWKSESGRQGDC